MTFDPHKRLGVARSYLELLPSAASWRWEDKHRDFLAGRCDPVAAMVLAHPMFYESGTDYISERSSSCPVRGDRRFPSGAAVQPLGCRADVIWGYACPGIWAPGLTADHLFPWGFGGPTVGDNLLPLCSLHNSLKSADIHLFPWESGQPLWLEATLARVARVRSI